MGHHGRLSLRGARPLLSSSVMPGSSRSGGRKVQASPGRHGLLWQLYVPYLLVSLVCILVVAWYTTWSQRRFHYRQAAADLAVRAQLLVGQVRGKMHPAHTDEINALCRDLGNRTGTRITVILPSGRVLGDSREAPHRMKDQRVRPEVAGALRGEIGISRQLSPRPMVYAAAPVYEGGQLTGAVRTSLPLTGIYGAPGRFWTGLAAVGLGGALLAAVLVWLVARHLDRPLEDITKAAERFARGDLAHELPLPDTKELAAAADAMNRMAGQLDERFKTIVRQRAETEAILSSMVEGVLAVDTDERVMSMNEAAAGLLELDPGKATGKTLQEVARNPALQEVAARALRGEEPVRGEIELHRDEERYLEIQATTLRDYTGRRLGTVLVLHDVTRLRRLENVRRDFVANVSHELRTPVTAIKGFVETLLTEGSRVPDEARRFLRIVGKQTDRLNAIIGDLLTLSRLEGESEGKDTPLERKRIIGVLKSAIEVCEHKAQAKNIQIGLRCDEKLEALINPPLLEQAVVNLVDNAITYSTPDSTVTVEVERSDGETLIHVRDRGVGIPSQHLPRIFERFYRVDRARSRREGGTGLGLAIVKHIMQAHGGSAAVQSTLGEGSRFTLNLPSS